MDYEELYNNTHTFERSLKDKNASVQKYIKSLNRASEKGDIKGALRDLSQLQQLNADIGSIVTEYKMLVEAFDTKMYLESGAFSEQMLFHCKQSKVDVKGDYPIYDMFPFRVKIDAENSDITVDNKKVLCLRPSYLVKYIKERQEKLFKAPFNAVVFLNELAECYDRAISVKRLDNPSLSTESDYYLKDLYTFMAPMQRFRREYDLQRFSFDLGQLLSVSNEVTTTKDGRQYQLGPGRIGKKHLRILDTNGVEHIYGEIRFFRAKQNSTGDE